MNILQNEDKKNQDKEMKPDRRCSQRVFGLAYIIELRKTNLLRI